MWHPQTNRFMNSRHVRCNEKMVYKNLKESPEKPEIRNSENTEKSEMSEEENTDANQRSKRYQSFPSQKEEKRSKEKELIKRKQDQKITYQRIKNKSKKRSRVCIQN